MENQEIYLYQTQSPAQSIDTGAGYFPQAPGITLSDGAILYTWRDDAYGSDASGTGLFDPFLTLQSNNMTESGTNFYSSGSYGTGDALSSGDSRTSSIKANLIPVVGYGGTEYYEIRLDVNEVNSAQKGLIDLNSFKVFGSDSATQVNGGGTLLYSLDTTSINKTIHIFDDSTGSGKSDVVMLIPKSYFSSNPEYLYFEASLSGTDGGFEEFSVRVLAADPPNPALTIAKVASVDTVDNAGDVVNYTITVANAGNVTLTGVVLTDEFANATLFSGDADSDSQLDVGESWIYTASHTVTQAEMDAGTNLVNLAIADTNETGPSQDDVSTRVLQKPDLSITKMANVDFVDAAGDSILYTITVENQGNITLDGVVVLDSMLTGSLTNDWNHDSIIDGDANNNSALDIGESWVWTGQYIVTQADIDAARATPNPYTINNTAYADSNQTGIEEASETVGVKVDFEGLSHGYWKTHTSDWDGVTTGTSFENFFFGSQQGSLKWQVSTGAKPNKFATVNDVTFDQALALTGGDQAALAREAVASILNIRDEDVTYRFTESQVKEWVSEALTNKAVDINNDGINEFAAGAAAITGVKNLLEFNNNLELV
jgi:uncharacterized repeat protein (TIGR01451 family)